jgi:AcrR family transcriptional regulator
VGGVRRAGPQARGIARRQLLVDASRELLRERDVDEINLADAASRAGIPKSSAYHFYPDIHGLFAEAALSAARELRDAVSCPVPSQSSWQKIFTLMLGRGVDFLRSDPSALRLLLGPKTSMDIKRSDRLQDLETARLVIAAIEAQYVLPLLPDREGLFFRAIEIFDLFLSLSVMDKLDITEDAVTEAHRASLAYLHLYVPRILVPVTKTPSRPPANVSGGLPQDTMASHQTTIKKRSGPGKLDHV